MLWTHRWGIEELSCATGKKPAAGVSRYHPGADINLCNTRALQSSRRQLSMHLRMKQLCSLRSRPCHSRIPPTPSRRGASGSDPSPQDCCSLPTWLLRGRSAWHLAWPAASQA
jgi:hypothetical protein